MATKIGFSADTILSFQSLKFTTRAASDVFDNVIMFVKQHHKLYYITSTECQNLRIICDPLQQKVPLDPGYMLLVWYKYPSDISSSPALQVKWFWNAILLLVAS